MAIPVIIGGVLKSILPLLKDYWRELLIIILVLIIVFMKGCGNKPVETRTVEVVVRDTIPVVRSTRANIDVIDSIYETIYQRMKDSVRVVRLIRDRVEVVGGDTVVYTDTIFKEESACWVLYREALEKLKATNLYNDTILIFDTIPRFLRKDKLESYGRIVLSEEVTDNLIHNRVLRYQATKKKVQRKWRIYVGLNVSYEEQFGVGLGVGFAWPKVYLGYSNQMIPLRNFHQLHFGYSIR